MKIIHRLMLVEEKCSIIMVLNNFFLKVKNYRKIFI